MDYRLAVGDGPETIPGGTGVLLVHPSTVETDRIDTAFLKEDTDRMLVISTRTTAREVRQKLDHYEVDAERATILDALSVERGFTRRRGDDVRYLNAPDDVEGLHDEVATFLEETAGKRRISLDSITEVIYYADVERGLDAVDGLLALLDDHDAVGLVHLAGGVHDAAVVDRFRERFPVVIDLDDEGTVTVSAE
ncbi:DUF7090 family protein [Halococcoides cellulosivorans]|uniref:KaiC-like domain-containing protein n=1 Tax=Halococcoides cellulosivorans TaxID=1679096 RepID=A0A2R4WZA3_9EURY|nr:hypothetical protein [Halococcoides cellulosivorans]AWB26872.1 hypothetical protein HARCEL1_03645 [Halococcoides cellulosivorans]